MNMLDFSPLLNIVVQPVLLFLLRCFWLLSIVVLAFLFYIFMKYHLRPWNITRDDLIHMRIRLKLVNFIRWFIVDLIDSPQRMKEFSEYGLTLYCGKQGSGKTISMVNYLDRMRHRYPECIIVTNFHYAFANRRMESWRDFFTIRNGTKGVIFAIDEIHSEYSSAAWKDFPEELLSEISQQRKQRVKIVASSQVFTRVVKPIREQAFSVVLCSTWFRRWTFNREYDAADFEMYCSSITGKEKLRTLWKTSFIQSDTLRRRYDTYEKIERLQKMEFINRSERGA